MPDRPNFYVFTGGSSSGKSSILDGLAARGFVTVPEAGRLVVQEEMATGGDGLPRINLQRFRDLIFEKSVQAFESLRDETGLVFFDRSFLEAISCSRGLDVPVPVRHQAVTGSHRFNRHAFVTPPWEEIFTNDAERKTTFAAAVQDYEMNVSVYREAGYDLIEVPRLPVEDRVDFVLGEIKSPSPSGRGCPKGG